MLNKLHMLVNRFGVIGKYFDEAKPRKRNDYYRQEIVEDLIQNPYAFRQGSSDLCEQSLRDAKTQLHPLLQQVDLEKLSQRREFVQAFKGALERAVAERIILWLPSVKVVYKFDPPRGSSPEGWDNRVHLLILVPRLLPSINELGTMLDHEILERLKHFGWSRFKDSQSILELQQVTPYEIRHGVCYGAMFYSYYTAPSEVWPLRSYQPD
jgi:hypothetical protein